MMHWKDLTLHTNRNVESIFVCVNGGSSTSGVAGTNFDLMLVYIWVKAGPMLDQLFRDYMTIMWILCDYVNIMWLCEYYVIMWILYDYVNIMWLCEYYVIM